MAAAEQIALADPGPGWGRGVKERRLIVRMLLGIRDGRRLGRKIERAQAAILHDLRSGRRFEELGHVRFGDFCLEALQIEPRTGRRRVALHAALSAAPELEPAYLAGRLDAGKILALRTVVPGPHAAPWIAMAGDLPVRELVAELRRAGGGRPPGDGFASPDPRPGEPVIPADASASPDPEGEPCPAAPGPGAGGAGPSAYDLSPEDVVEPPRKPVTFLAPETVALAFEHAIETARRVLGWDAPRDACLDALLSEAVSSLPWLAATPDAPAPEVPPLDWAPGGRLPWAAHPFMPASRWRVLHGFQPARRRKHGPRPWRGCFHRWEYARARNALRGAERALRRVERLVEPGAPSPEPAGAASPDPAKVASPEPAGAAPGRRPPMRSGAPAVGRPPGPPAISSIAFARATACSGASRCSKRASSIT